MNTVFLLILNFVFLLNAVTSTNLGEDLFPNCQQIVTVGYGYKSFFKLPRNTFQQDGSVIFKFSLSARSDGHIFLSDTANQLHGYEVVLGAGGNTFSEIRKYDKRRLSIQTPLYIGQILNDTEIRNFSIIVNHSSISVVNENPDLTNVSKVFLRWTDPSPFVVKYVSFCSWSSVIGHWFYDCHDGGLFRVPAKLSPSRTLKKLLLFNYDPYAVPLSDDDILTVNVALTLNYVNLDPKRSVMTTNAQFKISWVDPKLKWIPKDHGNITSFTLPYRQIWIPEFLLYNSFDFTASAMGDGVIRVFNNGSVEWAPLAQMVTWCSMDLHQWPFDEQHCNITLGVPSLPNSVYISLDSSHVTPSVHLKNIRWKLTKIVGETSLTTKPWLDDGNNEDSRSTFVIALTLARQSRPLFLTFLFSLFGASFITLSGMCLPPFCFKRMILQSVSLGIFVINLLTLSEQIPALPSSTPFLLSLNSNLLFFTCIQLIFSGFLLSFNDLHSCPPPKIVTRSVTHPLVRMLFCLSEVYEDEDQDMLICSQDPPNSKRSHWMLFSLVLHKLMLFLSIICLPLTAVL